MIEESNDGKRRKTTTILTTLEEIETVFGTRTKTDEDMTKKSTPISEHRNLLGSVRDQKTRESCRESELQNWK